MRRQDVQLLALARQGDPQALYEMGQRYLQGIQGFAQYTDLGLKYLAHPVIADSERSARIIAEALPLSELVRRHMVTTLTAAAHAGSAAACLKLGVWRALTHGDPADARELLSRAAAAGNGAASLAIEAFNHDRERPLMAAIAVLADRPELDTGGTVALALTQATRPTEVDRIVQLLTFAVSLPLERTPALCDAVCAALVALQRQRVALPALECARLHPMLEDCVKRRNAAAALLLGRALCGIDSAFAPSASLAPKRNLRGGTALLLRAADAGVSEAWLLLYRVHADGQGSVANPQAAVFFLEKAAASGNTNAQRQLGAMILKSAVDIAEFELGMHWMSQAAERGDAIARSLLRSFVLPVQGRDEDAQRIIEELARIDPWVAHRLRIARHFGLTKTEATLVDVVSGVRSWGLVVTSDAADHRLRSRFCRAIPALQADFLEHLHESAEFFRLAGDGPVQSNIDRRQKVQKLKYRLDSSNVDESLFFAQVPTARLAILRQGSSWAHGVKHTLRTAIAT